MDKSIVKEHKVNVIYKNKLYLDVFYYTTSTTYSAVSSAIHVDEMTPTGPIRHAFLVSDCIVLDEDADLEAIKLLYG